MQCFKRVKKTRLCRVDADKQLDDGRWVCHLHDPKGRHKAGHMGRCRKVMPGARPKAKRGPDRFKQRRDDVALVRGKQMYEGRGSVLAEMGFTSYQQYLESPLWSAIRKRHLKVMHYSCQICKDRANQVHHRQYRMVDLQGETSKQLVAICQNCHRWIEFDDDGTKLMDSNQINSRLDRLMNGFVRT